MDGGESSVGVAPRRNIGVVVIGRNEGERLRRCIASVTAPGRPVVYVDSGSTDESVAIAHSLGAEVVALDMRHPFTAARARNEGLRRLRITDETIDHVQFVDGDCEVASSWVEHAARYLDVHPRAAAVCGRRRERHPEASIYNLLCDIEWDTPVGRTKACGGDAAFRLIAFDAVGGFREDLIAGEEPELCLRLRGQGWEIWRIDAEMTLHDAAMSRFGQWWKRSMRAGFAYAQGASIHGASAERHWVRESRSALAWGLFFPAFLLASAWAVTPWAWFGFALYPVQVIRLGWHASRKHRAGWTWARFVMIAKFAEAVGWLRFHARRLLHAQAKIIEYK